jgi:hypothetical protein
MSESPKNAKLPDARPDNEYVLIDLLGEYPVVTEKDHTQHVLLFE